MKRTTDFRISREGAAPEGWVGTDASILRVSTTYASRGRLSKLDIFWMRYCLSWGVIIRSLGFGTEELAAFAVLFDLVFCACCKPNQPKSQVKAETCVKEEVDVPPSV